MLGGTREKERYRESVGQFRKVTAKEVAQAVLVAFLRISGTEAKDRIRHFLNKDPDVIDLAREGGFIR